MAAEIPGLAYRKMLLGNNLVQKSTGTLAATTVPLFTIAGGNVLVTAVFGLVTTSITVANSYKLQVNPTTGDTTDLTAATDIGTTDTVAGTILGIAQGTTAAPALLKGGQINSHMWAVPIGQIESVSAGTDGVILWNVYWVPLDAGATLVAA
jgi:hypothetical protein